MGVAMHFLMLAIGEVLKQQETVTAQDIQDYIQNDDAFGIRPPLADCRLALQLMTNSGFIIRKTDTEYKRVALYGK